MMIEIAGKMLNPDAIDALVPPVPTLGIPTQALMRSGDWIALEVPYEDVRAILLTSPPVRDNMDDPL